MNEVRVEGAGNPNAGWCVCQYVCVKRVLLAALIYGVGCGHGMAWGMPQGERWAPCREVKGVRRVSAGRGRRAVEIRTKMTVDVDGAPNAYGPKGRPTLDYERNAHAPKGSSIAGEVVGYMTEGDGGPPTVQGPKDPFPGYYVSQTAWFDRANRRKTDPRRYLDARRINYVVLGRAARAAGVRLGDFATVYSCRTGRVVFAIVGDEGNESGAEGSLALVQRLGYPIRDGKEDSVDGPELIVRYVPGSNAGRMFPKTQAELDRAARAAGVGLGR